MLTLGLSSYSLEIPKDAHLSLSQILIGCSLLSQSRVLQADLMISVNSKT